MRIVALTLLAYLGVAVAQQHIPIVLWHGMGDTCCNPLSLGKISNALKERLPEVHVHSLEIGSSEIEDFLSGYFKHPDDQVQLACNRIQADPLLANGYNAVGFSQGSQFLRALAQRCPNPKMKNLVTVGGQHQGVYGIPMCTIPLCSILTDAVNPFMNGILQPYLVQATYWHDAKNSTSYKEKNTFLAEINNENYINETYVNNLQSLQNIIFIKFEQDEMVIPRESQWFGFYKPNESKEIQSLQQSQVYDRLGLREMDVEGKLHFISTPGGHLQLSISWFLDEVVDRFFR